jgi:hydrogenase maturation protein HypF
MAKFTLCPACQAEYDNPLDRRFHAQPNACPVCGPQLSLSDGKTQLCSGQQDVIAMTVDLIQQGHIIAIKGIGGFHLACDASNQQAVANLRQRKQRFAKPFAIMARDLISLQNWVSISALEQQQLLLSAAPIVILAKQGEILADGVAPGQNSLGCMLPYTALHHTLMHSLAQPIVLTSANRNEEPQCIDNQEALHRLTGIADYWLLHNRDIVNRLDDSVVRVIDQQPRLLRRARGYAPEPLPLSLDLKGIPPIIGMGGELKNSFCLLQEQQAILSPYIGDLENAFVQQDYRRMLALYQELFHFQPKIIAVDGHERYLSSQLGQQWAEDAGIKLVTVQHHHAHIAACMAEYGLALDHAPVLGVAMDGLGWGDDGQLWGGEFLQVDYRSYQRLASFQAIPMLGGSQAMVQPWRNTYAYLKQYFAWEELNEQFADLEIMQYLNQQPIAVLDQMLFKKLNSPVSSSCGRWFDAFAAALGVCREHTSYEGQAAISLETVAEPVFAQERGAAYAFELTNENGVRVLNWRTFWLSVLLDLQRKVDKAVIAARIHHGLAQAIAITAIDLARQMGTEIVVLSGGVFQNRLLLEEVSQLLRSANKQPLSPVELPCNDGGLALGQVVIAAAIIARLD